jgi:CRP-like cAMP-binding protein
MPPTSGTTPVVENRLLAALPRKEFQQLHGELEAFTFHAKDVIYQPDEPIKHVYFVGQRMMASNIIVMEDGTSVEAGMTGDEGVLGLPAVYGDGRSIFRTLVQSSGLAFRLDVETLKNLSGTGTGLRQILDRFIGAYLGQVSQAGACNRLHALEQRLCRWLLMAHDRIGSEQLSFTHEFLANMLGVRRASVTESAVLLSDQDLIEYRWGKIWIRDRAGLEAICCECYRLIKERSDRLIQKIR